MIFGKLIYGFFVGPFLAAYKHADGKKIDGRRVVVDVERGRTVKGWLPRRLGKRIKYTCLSEFDKKRKLQRILDYNYGN